ncbi:uncharacterized protein [Temnothorax longispinosus]|uniref:uncharacterized protein n=1 Tax=Temnothorax longispinosus TaxID=300112 RepID=UPI003A992108
MANMDLNDNDFADFALELSLEEKSATDIAARPVAAGPIAARPVATGSIADRPVAAGSVADRLVVADRPVVAGPVAAGPVVADRAAAHFDAEDDRQVRRPRGRAAGIRRQKKGSWPSYTDCHHPITIGVDEAEAEVDVESNRILGPVFHKISSFIYQIFVLIKKFVSLI